MLKLQAWRIGCAFLLFFVASLLVPTNRAFGQFLDQGAITGTVQDNTGAIIPGAVVTLESPDTGFTLTATSDAIGTYVFSPIKIGRYTISVSAPGFQKAVQKNITVSQGQRLDISPKLNPGAVSETVTVTDAPPLLQTEASSVGQVLSAQEIVNTPLNGRNTMFLVQLTAGAAPAKSSRATASGDFDANGLRPEQNNFVIDGVDNNALTMDFLSGTSYLINPPPDALAEFKVSTSNYSAEFGHSAGAVVSASIKSGTNQIHGALWEYWRNDIISAHDWMTPTIPKGEYRQNQFGATLGLPIIKNKLFFFADAQANRIVINLAQQPISVPTLLERQGDFSELLNPLYLGGSKPQTLYQPQNNQTKMTCNGVQNVLCPGQINALAKKILNMYPLPNTNNGYAFNNYVYELKQPSNTFQWDARMDWDISSKDQAFGRFSYLNTRSNSGGPLGPILDGSCASASTCLSGSLTNFANNFVLSETHIFSSRLVNEARFAFNYGHFQLQQLNANENLSATLGFGGVPFGPDTPSNGGLPFITMSGNGGVQNMGTRGFRPEREKENEYQILDNFSWTIRNHTVRLGFSDQGIRLYTSEPPAPRPQYTFTGAMTAQPGIPNTGSSVADFLTNNMASGAIGPYASVRNAQNLISAYVQDDWKVNRKLTLNLGVRYDFFQPFKEMANRQANFYVTSVGVGTGKGVYAFPAQMQGKLVANPNFFTVMAKDNISIVYDNNSRLTKQHNLNFAPRVGFAYSPLTSSVIRAGFGMFYQGQQFVGASPTLGFNYPFIFTNNFLAPSCPKNSASCANNGYTLDTGFSNIIAQGLTTYFNVPSLVGQSPNMKTTYSMDYNLTFEQSITKDIVATIGYVGTGSRHLPFAINSNSSTVLIPSGSIQSYLPFPDLNGSTNVLYEGISKYDGLQTKLQKRMSHNVNLLATYTWSHSRDDASDPLGQANSGYRNPNIIPIRDDMADSSWDVRHRFTFNGLYMLPFGRNQKFLSQDSRIVEAIFRNWSTNMTYSLQSGQPFTVGTANITTAVGGSAFAIQTGDPFKGGGTPDPTNPSITCPTTVRNKAHWFNPCAFKNPLPASAMTGNISDAATAKMFLGNRSTITGPSYQRLDMSLSKHFVTFREQYVEVRGDGFNMFNTQAWGQPSSGIGQTGGLINSARPVQSYTPNSRFFQLSAKYVF